MSEEVLEQTEAMSPHSNSRLPFSRFLKLSDLSSLAWLIPTSNPSAMGILTYTCACTPS